MNIEVTLLSLFLFPCSDNQNSGTFRWCCSISIGKPIGVAFSTEVELGYSVYPFYRGVSIREVLAHTCTFLALVVLQDKMLQVSCNCDPAKQKSCKFLALHTLQDKKLASFLQQFSNIRKMLHYKTLQVFWTNVNCN